jgi:membrane protein YqaA with SNARE-associated domain
MFSRFTVWYEKMEERIKRAAYSKHAWRTLFIVSYLENFISPIPGDILVAPLSAQQPERKWFIVAYATGASILGSLTGYLIGFFLFQSIGAPLVAWYGGEDAFVLFKTVFEKYGFATLFVVAFTPLPDKVFTVLSGVASLSLFPFVLAMTLGRALRFAIVAYLAATYGRSAYTFLRTKFGLVTFIISIVVVAIILFSSFAVQ